jgi:hypothetical protein
MVALGCSSGKCVLHLLLHSHLASLVALSWALFLLSQSSATSHTMATSTRNARPIRSRLCAVWSQRPGSGVRRQVMAPYSLSHTSTLCPAPSSEPIAPIVTYCSGILTLRLEDRAPKNLLRIRKREGVRNGGYHWTLPSQSSLPWISPHDFLWLHGLHPKL